MHIDEEQQWELDALGEGDGEVDREDIHPASKQDVELYIRTFTTMLRSSGEVKIKALVQAHLNADSALHVNARDKTPDMSAFFYCVQRLPDSIMRVRRVLLGQSAEVFARQGFNVEQWEPVTAPGRRRRWFYDDKETLAVYVSSASDVDDLIPTLTGFQIQWNKSHRLLARHDLCDRPVYFVSSNTPALVNVLGGTVLREHAGIEDYIRNSRDQELITEYEKLIQGQVRSSLENLLYYASRRYFLETD